MSDRKIWTPSDVVDVSGPSALLRNYLEQQAVRQYLLEAASNGAIGRAYDVGCGFGRVTPVLAEVAGEVIGYEREASLVEMARRLLPDVRFELVTSLDHLPAPNASATFVLIFTVLQHMPDEQAEAVLADVRRVLAPGGHALVVEETDVTLEAGDPAHADQGYTRGRAVDWYAARLRSSTLCRTSPRRIEPGYPRPDVGTYMFFRG